MAANGNAMESTGRTPLLEYRIPGMNERQIQIVRLCVEKPGAIYTSKELVTRFSVSVKTVRSDLESLVKERLVDSISPNKLRNKEN